MTRERQNSLSDRERDELLTILEEQGKTKWCERWKQHMAFPTNLNPLSKERSEQEKVLRYLLLRVLINQQAKFEKVREMSVRIGAEFADVLLFEPYKVPESELFRLFKDVAGEKGSPV